MNDLIDHPLMSVQLALEKEMIEGGSEKFFEEERKKSLKGEEADTKGARYVIRSLITPIEQAIKNFMAEASSGRPGRKHSVLPLLKGHNPATVAFLTLREGLNAVSNTDNCNVQSAARWVARAVQNEQHLRLLSKANPEMFNVVRTEAMAHSGSEMRARVAAALLRHVNGHDLDARTEVALGTKLLDLAIEATGVFVAETTSAGNGRDKTVLTLSRAAVERIAQTRELFAKLGADHMPYVVPPRPWTSPTKGVSWSGAFRKLHLVHTRDKEVTPLLAELELGPVFEAVNAIQETPWKVNTRVLAVLEEAFDSEKGVASLPERAPDPPPFPDGAILASDAFRARKAGDKTWSMRHDKELIGFSAQIKASALIYRDWKKAASMAFTTQRKNKAKRVAIRHSIDLAKRFAAYEAIYFPHYMDFRGRLYPFCTALSPQGADTSKGLLTFSTGKLIGDGDGPGWLAVHGANTWGFDKASLDERIEWVEDRAALIRGVAEDPWSSPGLEFWIAADKPWQFLAFCFEWAGFLAEGAAFVSSLPVAMDGSCNGLQHYSAALRDSVGGAAVNLVPSDKPADIYGVVAERALAKVRAFLCPDSPADETISGLETLREFWSGQEIDPEEVARGWLTFGVDRKITKRSVMTLPYGSTQFSCRDFIEAALIEKIDKGAVNVWRKATDKGGESLFKASLFLQPFVWQAIGETVKAAREGMEWLQACARVVAQDNLPILWTLPDGFVVRQAYRAYKTDRIETFLGGRAVKLSVRADVTEQHPVDKRLQSQGVAPNWVHSQDAAALRAYVRLAKDYGITQFALVHDSYGALAADTGLMLVCLKRAFLDLYTAQDPLACFRLDMVETVDEARIAELPPLPPRGDLDLERVLESDFFFA